MMVTGHDKVGVKLAMTTIAKFMVICSLPPIWLGALLGEAVTADVSVDGLAGMIFNDTVFNLVGDNVGL